MLEYISRISSYSHAWQTLWWAFFVIHGSFYCIYFLSLCVGGCVCILGWKQAWDFNDVGPRSWAGNQAIDILWKGSNVVKVFWWSQYWGPFWGKGRLHRGLWSFHSFTFPRWYLLSLRYSLLRKFNARPCTFNVMSHKHLNLKKPQSRRLKLSNICQFDSRSYHSSNTNWLPDMAIN